MVTQLQFRGNSAYWKSFKWGTIIPSESTFIVVPRSRKNIFKIFNGLGINEELLILLKKLNIEYIDIPFCGKVLKTTTDKYLREGVRSPFCNERVDRQLVLNIDRINTDEKDYPRPAVKGNRQLSLQFDGV